MSFGQTLEGKGLGKWSALYEADWKGEGKERKPTATEEDSRKGQKVVVLVQIVLRPTLPGSAPIDLHRCGATGMSIALLDLNL